MDAYFGCNGAMVRLAAYLPKVARSDVKVLITGETGTGKERLAEAIHALSGRAAEPMISVNCAALPDTLIESELFGYERGAFTGAQSSYPGKLRLAKRGTIFLDEIGEMSLFAQAKLLHVLESGTVFPLGGSRSATVAARFIAATNQELEPLVARGAFRADLFYRLNVARLQLPPLRERREDIVGLFDHFVTEFNASRGGAATGASAELRRCLLAYDWPGNVRELRNLVEVIFIEPPPGEIGLDDIPDTFRRLFARYRTTKPTERDRMIAALTTTNWNKSRAAADLNWSRMTLYRKLRQYQLGDSPSL
jgi:transcriptional regulator with PAS, ATPase and Fis domain